MIKNPRIHNFLQTFGPGIVFASTCIGVSHLVQSTRAGASYGFVLLWAILLANIFKYPFFEFSARYTNATRESILEGYNRIGKWILILYVLVTLFTMFIVTAAVVIVTAGLVSNLFPIQDFIPDFMSPGLFWAIIIFGFCLLILTLGEYSALDSLLKGLGAVLLVSTLVAFGIVLFTNEIKPVSNFVEPDLLAPESLMFIVALMGWMPIAVDMSAWNSLWIQERFKQTKYIPSLKETLLDFHIGYITSIILAICFLTLGAKLMYGTGITFQDSASGFAAQLINLFTSALGKWSYYIIALAAFSTMFSTSITLIDGYCRSMERSLKIIFSERPFFQKYRTNYLLWMYVLAGGAMVVLIMLSSSLKKLVDLATTTSFVIAPLAAFLNYKLITSKFTPKNFHPPLWLKLLGIAGIIFLTLFTVLFVLVEVKPDIFE